MGVAEVKTHVDYSTVSEEALREHAPLVHWYIRRDGTCRRALERGVCEMDDLVSAGLMGLAHALATHKISTHAVVYIRQRIQEVFRQARWKHAEYASTKDDVLHKARTETDLRGADDDGPVIPIAIDHSDPAARLADEDEIATLRKAIRALPAQMRSVMERRATGATMEQVAAELGLTRQRIQQVEAKALPKLRNSIVQRNAIQRTPRKRGHSRFTDEQRRQIVAGLTTSPQ